MNFTQDTNQLPQWAVNLLAARGVRRIAQAYRKAHRRCPNLELFEKLATELERDEPDPDVIRAMKADFEAAYQCMKTRETRAPGVAAAGVCEAHPTERWRRTWFDVDSCCTGVDKAALAADRKLHDRTRAHDEEVARSAPDRQAAMRALAGVWPLGEPKWLGSKWFTYRKQQAIERTMWGDDEPSEPSRTATLPSPSTRLAQTILEVLTPTRWNLMYRAGDEIWTTGEQPGQRSLLLQKPKKHSRRFTLPGRHGFRKPAPAAQRAALAALARSVPSLRSLSLFYREHDGALLFRARGTQPVDAHVRIHGLEDQPRAIKQLLYHLNRRKLDFPGEADRFLHRWGCDRNCIIVIATVGASMFFIPLRGRYTGKVVRVFLAVDREELWANSFVDGLSKFRAKLVTLVARHEIPIRLGDEAKGGLTLFTLAKVAAADQPAKPRRVG